MKEKIRYSDGWSTRENAKREGYQYEPKNTLVTLDDGEYIYFGISRCNLAAGDRFIKREGRELAREKAKLAVKKYEKSFFHVDGLSGVVRVSSIIKLLDYFHEIDDIMKPYF